MPEYRIGLISGEFPPMEGGIGAFTDRLAQALADLGHEVHIITDRRARPEPAQRRLSTINDPVSLGYAQLHPRIRGWRWPTLATMADICLRHELEIVNIQYQAAAYNMRSPAINLLPWRLQGLTTTVVTMHDLRVPYLLPKAGRLRQLALRFMMNKASGVIVTNRGDLAQVRAQVSSPSVTVPIGSNVEYYAANHVEIEEVRQSCELDGDDILLGYFGFLNESKGADTLLQALAGLDDHYHLVFIGGESGDSDPTNIRFVSQLKAWIETSGLAERVHWTGFMSDIRVSAHLQAADLMVMPYRDGVSLRRGTLMAILAQGRPLVTTTPATPVPELIDGDNVVLVPPANVTRLQQAIGKLGLDSQLRRQLGERAAELASKFSWPGIAAETAAFYGALLAPAESPAG